ncbi:amidohydrolase family protein [Kibdelosporangium persicum]|uniref:N-substituted formamide deformylase n=1 Tax=Kibdelosporangium persicum TaxID=2698649 RepID=A0ABX2FGH0_9PSEU|nr:amidohydrolase family protein [Kibdelosporangium persicum]NRN70214.1 N-substituted formamide deformylase [Kibdelosporangium persicum]
MPTPVADLVLRGGPVHTLAGPGAATALAIRSGRVLRVGADADIRGLIGPGTDIVDLAGRAVIPGINDAHLHATWLGALWPDTLFGDHPDPRRPLCSPEERRAAILGAGDLLARLGITSYTEPGLGPGEDEGPTGAFGMSVVRQYRALAAEGLLRARVTALWLYGELDGPSTLADLRAGLTRVDGSGSDRKTLNFAGVKIFADGIPPMRSAYTHHCYADGSRAELLVAGEDDAEREENLTAMILAAHHAGLQVGVHATGDRAIDLVLDAVERARAERDVDLRHYVIHGDMVNPMQLKRMARLGVGLSTQAGIAVQTSDAVSAVLGAERAESTWPLRDVLDIGIPLCLTSDAPVLSPDWRREIAAADEWMGPADNPRDRMETLLRCYTVHPARQDGAETWKGTLAEGMVADLCVLAADPLAVTAAELPDVDVDLTVLGGRVVYER